MHEHEDAEMRAILERIEGYYGFIPKIYQEMQRNPTALRHFFTRMSNSRLIELCLG